MIRRHLVNLAATACLALPLAAAAATPLDDPNTVLTVMQFSAKDAAALPELKKRMAAMRDYLRKQPGYIENALMENRNSQSKPQFVGVSRWKSFKDWENLWLKDDFQKLVRSISEVGELTPGTFAAVK
jgi:heme-degrading monooxygenase HmoA